MLDPLIHYKNRSIVAYKNEDGDHCGYGYTGRKIEYQDGFARVKFTDSFGDELVKEGGELLRGECCGHINVEIWGNEFELQIETASGNIVEMDGMNIKLLRKLNNFLNYALNDKVNDYK